MKPVTQTIFGDGRGNCFSAAIASILEVDLARIPTFCANETTWYEDAQAWLSKGRLGFFTVCLDGKTIEYMPASWVVVSGTGPRGPRHSVVGRIVVEDGKRSLRLVHDPHPSGEMLLGDLRDWTIDMFVVLDPAGEWAA